MYQNREYVSYVAGGALVALPIAFMQLQKGFEQAHYVLPTVSIALLIVSIVSAIALPHKMICVGSLAIGMSMLTASFMLG
jgi:hypothetical protein